MPARCAPLTTARMTALRPGASPPPVSMPIFLTVGISSDVEGVCEVQLIYRSVFVGTWESAPLEPVHWRRAQQLVVQDITS